MGNPLHRLYYSASSSTRRWGKKSCTEQEALGRSRGGFCTKIHFRCEGTGRLITFLLTPGQESDINLAQELMETGAIRRSSGQIRLRPQCLVADKGYTSQAFRSCLHQKHIRCTIARRSNERRRGSFEKLYYCKRNIIERLLIGSNSSDVLPLVMRNALLISLL